MAKLPGQLPASCAQSASAPNCPHHTERVAAAANSSRSSSCVMGGAWGTRFSRFSPGLVHAGSLGNLESGSCCHSQGLPGLPIPRSAPCQLTKPSVPAHLDVLVVKRHGSVQCRSNWPRGTPPVPPCPAPTPRHPPPPPGASCQCLSLGAQEVLRGRVQPGPVGAPLRLNEHSQTTAQPSRRAEGGE